MKKIFGMVAIAVVAAVNVVASLNGNTTMSDLKLDNVEAMAYNEIVYIRKSTYYTRTETCDGINQKLTCTIDVPNPNGTTTSYTGKGEKHTSYTF